MKNHMGFSLVEVMVTVTVIAVVSVFSFPSIHSWKKKEQVRGEIRQMVNSLMNAKFEAIKQNKFVVFQFANSGYNAFVDDGANGGNAKDWIRQPGEKEIVNHKTMDRLTLTTNYPSDRMRFRGRIGINAGTVIVLKEGIQNTKVVLNLTGRVRVEKI